MALPGMLGAGAAGRTAAALEASGGRIGSATSAEEDAQAPRMSSQGEGRRMRKGARERSGLAHSSTNHWLPSLAMSSSKVLLVPSLSFTSIVIAWVETVTCIVQLP